jgi:hypothetical protein
MTVKAVFLKVSLPIKLIFLTDENHDLISFIVLILIKL